MENLKIEFEETATKNWKHLAQISQLEDIFFSAKMILEKIRTNKYRASIFTQKNIQITIITDALCDMHQTMLFSLKEGLFYSVSPLARISLEHAINLIYILDDDTSQRTNQLSRNYIETTYKKSELWFQHEKEFGTTEEIFASKKKFDFIKFVKNSNASLMKKCSNWPNTFERFKQCGAVKAYRTIYAMNSDSVHCLSEDMFNFGTISKYPAQLQKCVLDYLKSQNASLSVYLFCQTLRFFCFGLQKYSLLVKNDECNANLNRLCKELSYISEIHNIDLFEDLIKK
ncbi:DUF5677 domain-containing protein [Mycoavidus sp. B2-EB]|uniref:DUF5677 domain-containing protein n=1 Tax=Mycoavidus sp. B2-EB TaxID=2651972 RepID=UPI001627CE22|nr:DUF5677 domain-containing protein [Mycoavidus sp. B2-EB]BBO58909.1 hypothetical protein MPB2EB_0004 [Mycoavidus sp. B2-EB]